MICRSSETLDVGADEVGVKVAAVVVMSICCRFFIKSSAMDACEEADTDEAGVMLNSRLRTISGGKVGLWLLLVCC